MFLQDAGQMAQHGLIHATCVTVAYQRAMFELTLAHDAASCSCTVTHSVLAAASNTVMDGQPS